MVRQTEADDEDRTPEQIRADAFDAAADALEGAGYDQTGGARYNKNRRYDRAFNAAMNVLSGIPLDAYDDDLVRDVDRVCQKIRASDIPTDDVVDALRAESAIDGGN